jgi:hypothetical protein
MLIDQGHAQRKPARACLAEQVDGSERPAGPATDHRDDWDLT